MFKTVPEPVTASPTSTTVVSRSTSPASSGRSSPRSKSPYSQTRSSVPLAPIPPSNNPRGELIFSSKVTPAYREGYEKYRGDWEKRRKPSKYEMSWATYAKSYFVRPKPVPKASASMEKSSSGEKVKAKPLKAGVVYAATSPSEVSEDSSSSAAAVRGRDTRARPLLRTGSSSSLSSGFSASPPGSRRSSPLRNSLSKPSSPESSRPTTPDLIREENEAEEMEVKQVERPGSQSLSSFAEGLTSQI